MNYDAMTIDELQAEFVNLGAQLVTITNCRNDVLTLIEKRKADVRAKAVVKSLSEMEKDALRVELAVDAKQ